MWNKPGPDVTKKPLHEIEAMNVKRYEYVRDIATPKHKAITEIVKQERIDDPTFFRQKNLVECKALSLKRKLDSSNATELQQAVDTFVCQFYPTLRTFLEELFFDQSSPEDKDLRIVILKESYEEVINHKSNYNYVL